MAKENLFKMGVDFGGDWSSDNKDKSHKKISTEIKEPSKHQLHFAKEKRRGKVVTIVKPFCLTSNDLKALLKSVKKKLGTGGTMRENTLEFQGELQLQLKNILESLGYRFKK